MGLLAVVVNEWMPRYYLYTFEPKELVSLIAETKEISPQINAVMSTHHPGRRRVWSIDIMDSLAELFLWLVTV